MLRTFVHMLIAAAVTAPVTAAAADQNVELTNQIMVERTVTDAAGNVTTTLEPPSKVVPGDKLVFKLSFHNRGAMPATGFAVTNPLPSAVTFVAADQDAILSVDGGKTWGKLDALTVALADGKTRAAVPSDVTHVRWAFKQPIDAGASGTLTFRGAVK